MERYTRLSHIQHDIQSNKITLRGLVSHYLERIEGHKNLNAFLEVFADEALQRAEEVQAKITAGTAGKGNIQVHLQR